MKEEGREGGREEGREGGREGGKGTYLLDDLCLDDLEHFEDAVNEKE